MSEDFDNEDGGAEMSMKSEVAAALQAHAAWRKKFKDILNGRVAFDLATISATDQCFFW